MCYKQNYHYEQCDHWVHRVSVCLDWSDVSSCVQRGLPEIHYSDRCQYCIKQSRQLPKAFHHLRLTDRFYTSAAPISAPAFTTVKYDKKAPNHADEDQPTPAPASPKSVRHQHLMLRCLCHTCFEKDADPSTSVRTCTNANNQAGCGIIEQPIIVATRLRKDEIRLTEYQS